MKFVWFTWKDREHPLAGGAEVVNEEIAKRLAKDGHEVRFIVAGFGGCKKQIQRDGFTIIRVGGRVSVYWEAYRYYKKNLLGWADKVIDEMNTVPFFAKFYSREPVTLFVHQLCREIWFYEMPIPFSLIGYLMEPVYLWLLRDQKVITVSESTKKDLMRFGFKKKNIHIISEGIDIEPVTDPAVIKKADPPIMLALGSIRAMKRTDHIVRAFEIAKKSLPTLRLVVAGKAEGRYGKKVLKKIKNSPFAKDISYLGPVSKEKKIELMRSASVICVASVKEGWGLIVTEANSQGTPAVVYDVDGLRDSVKDGETGIVCKENTPEGMAGAVVRLFSDKKVYDMMKKHALEWAKTPSFERGCKEFLLYI